MNVQWMVVGVVVALSAGYAAWTLMPGALRRAVATALLRLRLPRAVAGRIRSHAEAAAASGCSGCARNPLATAADGRPRGEPRPIKVHRRLPG